MLDPFWWILLSFRTFFRAASNRCAAVWSFVVCSELSASPDLNIPAEAV